MEQLGVIWQHVFLIHMFYLSSMGDNLRPLLLTTKRIGIDLPQKMKHTFWVQSSTHHVLIQQLKGIRLVDCLVNATSIVVHSKSVQFPNSINTILTISVLRNSVKPHMLKLLKWTSYNVE